MMTTAKDANGMGFATPVGDDEITDGDDAITQNAIAAADHIRRERIKRGRWTDPGDAFTLAEGIYTIASQAAADRLENLPESFPGTLEVIGNPGQPVRVIRFAPFQREYSFEATSINFSGEFTPWRRREDSHMKGRLLGVVDAFTLPPGVYTIGSAIQAERTANLPEEWPGTLVITGNPGEGLKVARFYPYQREHSWETVSAGLSNQFMPWRRVGGGEGASPLGPNSIRQAQMVHHYGPVDTGGRGAVSWRIDHGLVNFRDKMLPIFRAAGIVPMITLNSRTWEIESNAGVSQSEVNQWVADGWVEISNHGTTHDNVEGDEAIEAYVADGLAELEAQIPAAKGKIFGFHIAGVGVPGAFGGFQGGATPEQWDTTMGRAILRHHAFGSGHIPGTHLRVLDGQIRQGLLHMATDARPVSEITAQIDAAIAERKGFQIMSHPSTLDTPDRHTTADIQAIVNYIVAKRDAGALAVLSPYQMMLADATMSERATGTLEITSLFTELTNGRIYVQRTGSEVEVTLYDAEFGEGTPPTLFYLEGLLPEGYRPGTFKSFPALLGSTQVRRIRFQPDGQILIYSLPEGGRINVVASYRTPDPEPAS